MKWKRIWAQDRMTQDDLINILIGRIGAVKYSRVSRQAIEDAECDLGFPLPPFLHELYLHVGNGGFGPRGGLLGRVCKV